MSVQRLNRRKRIALGDQSNWYRGKTNRHRNKYHRKEAQEAVKIFTRRLRHVLKREMIEEVEDDKETT